MIKYIKQPDGTYTSHDTESETYQLLIALPPDRRPEFLDESDAGVKAYLEEINKPRINSVTARQARQYLILNGLINHVETQLNAIENEQERQIALNYWEYSTEFQIDNPVLLSIGGFIGLDKDSLPAIFLEASKL